MPSSYAAVRTDAPARYAKQLASHMSRRIDATWDGSAGALPFPFGHCALRAEEGELILEAEAPDEAELSRVEEVVGSHLERFGRKNELVVSWQRAQPG
ncbi:MAG: DUF2218 domain-containing protein [Streptosporangiales bacterium]|nr:DUF2218 domain-containing protein [Streptosporangiales bacterium]